MKDDDDEANERLNFIEESVDVQADLVGLIAEHTEKIKVETNEDSCQTKTITNSDFIKLPSVPAPKFDGTVQDWPSFIDTFNAIFHNNSGIACVQKFHYLKSCIVGPAAEIIKTFPTTEQNYMRTYEALVARYENNGLIIQSHIRSLFDSPKVQNASATELRKLHHHVVSHVRALEALCQPVSHWDAWLVTLICSRLDNVTVGEWQLKQTSRDLPKYSCIETFLFNRVAAYEAGEISNQYNVHVERC